MIHLMKSLRSEGEIISTWDEVICKPVVSICCITYNHEEFIEDAIRSFLGQVTTFPFEILIHDDASTDKTAEVIRRYEKLYPKLIKPIYQKENQFSKDARVNQVFNFSRAQGKYIALCDGDDYWKDVRKLQIQKDFLENNSSYSICYSDVEILEEDSTIELVASIGVRRDLSSTELQLAPSINTSTAFFRNAIKVTPREFTNSPCSDLLFWSLLGDSGHGKYLSQIKPSVYRLHRGGIHSMEGRRKQLQLRLEAMMALYSYRKNRSEQKLSSYFLGEIITLSLKLGGRTLLVQLFVRLFRVVYRRLYVFFNLSPEK
jgi:glycosyltransferase involved in cell wall biosynthesis